MNEHASRRGDTECGAHDTDLDVGELPSRRDGGQVAIALDLGRCVESWDDQRVRIEHGSRKRIGLSSMRQKAIAGAPMRSDPKLGNACA